MPLPPKTVEAFAPAKINLTLYVTGQRDDGYHLLDSLVVFADVGDVIRLRPAEKMSLRVTGPQRAGVPGDETNLVWRAAQWFGTPPVAIELEKHLPPASGIGGGSSDAAATLRALSQLWGKPLPQPAETVFLGADVPVCLHARPCRISGIGEIIEPIENLPRFYFLLVNPGVSLVTQRVFKAMERRDYSSMPVNLPNFHSLRDASLWINSQRNDLEHVAATKQPVIRKVLQSLKRSNAPIVRMSGSGATCFAASHSKSDPYLAEHLLVHSHPEWWVRWAASWQIS